MILGLSFGYHDSAAALIGEHEVFFADHEERYSRVKFDPRFPEHVLGHIATRFDAEGIATVVAHEKPVVKLDRQLTSILNGSLKDSLAFAEHAAALRKHRDWQRSRLVTLTRRALQLEKSHQLNIRYSEHHLSHAAAAYYTSPFDTALVLVLDAVGEWESSSLWIGEQNELRRVWSQSFPHSIGLFYSSMTHFLGLKVNSGEYKLMGLAPYGVPRYTGKLREVIREMGDGRIELNLSYFEFVSGRRMTGKKLENFLGRPRRLPNDPIDQWHADIAASVQDILEASVQNILIAARERLGPIQNLCIAGGVGLNCVMNAKVADEIGRANVHIFPASGDAGGAVGGALAFAAKAEKRTLRRWAFNNSLLGRSFDDASVEAVLARWGIRFTRHDVSELESIIAARIAQGAIVGVFHGPGEFGPRALGNRSIFADARVDKGQIALNERIKFRESFRPFAPIALEEYAGLYFRPDCREPFMLRTSQVIGFEDNRLVPDPLTKGYNDPISISDCLDQVSSPLPSVTHLDGSARLQTVPPGDPRLARGVLEKFYELTGCPVLINTSFNVRGEPIVGSPFDAIRCFATTGLDALCVGPYLVEKANQPDGLLSQFVSAVGDD